MVPIVEKLKSKFSYLPRCWDGQMCVEEMREKNYPHWRQMEWIGFYFQMKCEALLSGFFEIPGESFRAGSVKFDGKYAGVNYDFKAHSMFTYDGGHSKGAILNDKFSMEESIRLHGHHGLILAELSCMYDLEGDFARWHQNIKGKESQYVREGRLTGRANRRRKTSAIVLSILLLTIRQDNLQYLKIYKQGKNADGSPRNLKYMLDTQFLAPFDPLDLISK